MSQFTSPPSSVNSHQLHASELFVFEFLKARQADLVSRSCTFALSEGVSGSDVVETYSNRGYRYREIEADYPGTKIVLLYSDEADRPIIRLTFINEMGRRSEDGATRSSKPSFFTKSDGSWKVQFRVYGLLDEIEAHIAAFENDFGRAVDRKVFARWAYISDRGMETTDMPIKELKHFHKEFYPYIADVDAYVDGFANSDSNVLIINGDPGSGKSSLLKYMLQRLAWSSMVSYDQELMCMDKFYMDFIKNDGDVLILEDADLLLGSRENAGNKAMSKILNISDGILSSKGKKYIFTANLHSLSEVDPALTRQGRCYGLLQTRPLNHAEALAAASKIGKDLIPKNGGEYTVAEIYSGKDKSDNVVSLGKMGFAR